MKNLKNYLFLALLSLSVTSCLVDDEVTSDAYASSPSLAGFTAASLSANTPATGDVVPFSVPVSVTGPSKTSITENVTMTYAVNVAESTAIEGTHFQMTSSSSVLAVANNLYGSIKIDILTAGIAPPLAVAPYIILDVTSVTGGNGALVNGRTQKVKITINYLCFSDLAGTYTIAYTSGNLPHYVTPISDGLYQLVSMFGYPTGGYVVKFTDVCGDLTLLNEWNFTNNISGVGTVSANGNLVWTGVSVEDQYSGNSYTMVKQ